MGIDSVVLVGEEIDVILKFVVHFFVLGDLFAVHVDCVFQMLNAVVGIEKVFIDMVYNVVRLPCSRCENSRLRLLCLQLVQLLPLLI